MKRNTLFCFLAIAALGLVMAGPASAQPCTFTWKVDASTSAWRTPGNWEPSACGVSDLYPEAGDTAIIQAVTGDGVAPVIDDQDEALGELDIENGGLLTITGKTLTLGGTAQHDIDGDLNLANHATIDSVLQITGAATLDITGRIVLEASDAKAVLDLDVNVTVSGAGQIKGEDNAAEIQIAAGKVLTSTMSIVGRMKIVGETGGTAGKLDNRGAVLANADGTLELDLNLLLADSTGSGRWEASGDPDAVLLFSNAHTCALLGDFRVGDCATIQFNVDLDTEGSLSHDATNNKGTIDVENGSTFGYSCNTDNPCVCTDITSDTTLGCP